MTKIVIWQVRAEGLWLADIRCNGWTVGHIGQDGQVGSSLYDDGVYHDTKEAAEIAAAKYALLSQNQ